MIRRPPGSPLFPHPTLSRSWTAPALTSPWGPLLGYAQFPGGPAATDGVVILHSAFGTTGTATPPFHLGRTTTHEVGRSEEHMSELQSRQYLVCRLLLDKKTT